MVELLVAFPFDGSGDEGCEPESNKDAALIVATLLRPLANAGPAVVPLDHVTKNKDARGRYAIGAQHKLAAVRGAAYHLETVHPFGRGTHGQAQLIIQKDRPGHIRGEHSIALSPKRVTVGDFYLDATSRLLNARVAPPTENQQTIETSKRQNIAEFIAERYGTLYRGLSANEVYKGLGGNHDELYTRLDDMVASGELDAGPLRKGHATYLPGGALPDA